MSIKTILAALVSVTAMGMMAFGEAPTDAKIPMTVLNPVVPSPACDPNKLVDGKTDVNFSFFYFTGEKYGAIRSFVLDFNGAKTLTRMRACTTYLKRFNFSFYVSETGADGDWLLFKQTTESMSEYERQWLEFAVPEELAGKKFRYAKIYADGANGTWQMQGCCELEFYTTDMTTLTFEAQGVAVKGVASPEGSVKGKFFGAGDSANLCCCVAETDLGEDYAAWKEGAQEFTVAENVSPTEAGTAYSGVLPNLDIGNYCLRMFAVSGDKAVASVSRAVVVLAKGAKIPMTAVDCVVPSAASDPKNLVDGSVNVNFSFSGCTGEYDSIRSFVLDFGGLKSLVRMRACTTWSGRFDLSFFVSATGADNDWHLVVKTTDEMSTSGHLWLDFPIPDELAEQTFRYVKIQSDNGANPGCNELEFYTSDLSVSFTAPAIWMKGNAAAAAQSLQGRLFGLDAPAANVYCYVASEDLGEDYAAWKEQGEELLLAEDLVATEEGAAFVGDLPDLSVGYNYLRVFAVVGKRQYGSPTCCVSVLAPDVKIPMTVVNPVVPVGSDGLPIVSANPNTMVDGSVNNVNFSFYNFTGQYASIRSFVFDFGDAKKLTRMRACAPWANRFAFSFFVSATGADDDWQLVTKTTNPMATSAYQWFEFSIPAELADKTFRYAKIQSDNDANPGCNELEFYTQDASLTFDQPSTWESFAVAQASAGIGVQGKFIGLEDAVADIYCYVAKEDLGEDRAAWQTKGQEFLLTNGVAATTTGTRYCGKLPEPKKGYCYLRAFAVMDGKTVMGPLRFIVSQATPAATVCAYVTSKARSGDEYSATWVNGIIDGTQYESAATAPWTIFDLKPYNDAGLYVSGVRLFSRINSSRRNFAAVEWAYDDPDNPASWQIEQNLYDTEDKSRTLDYVLPENVPALDWQPAANADVYWNDSRINDNNSVVELTTLPAAQRSLVKTYRREGKLPRYLRVGKVQSNALVEIELRLSKIPPGAFAIVVK